jgi:predicted nucleotidyltransferase
MELNYEKIRRNTLEVKGELELLGYNIQTVLLFGSHAKGTQHAKSDIDLAFVSKHFGKDSSKENALLNKLLYKRIDTYDVIAISLKDFMEPFPLSPIVWEVKKHGVALF